MNKKIKTYALALLAMFLWGSAFPVVKLTYESFNILADDVANKMLIAGIRLLAVIRCSVCAGAAGFPVCAQNAYT